MHTVKFYGRFKYYRTFLQNTKRNRMEHETKIVRDLYIRGCTPPIFSERELTFTFAIRYRPSVCHLSSVCRL